MRAMVMEIINTRKDRGLIVSEARRRALTEPAGSCVYRKPYSS
jgi:hypothetical protein